jgi:hypothetical protein
MTITVLLFKLHAEVALRRYPLVPERERWHANLDSLLFLKREHVEAACPRTLPCEEILTGLCYFTKVETLGHAHAAVCLEENWLNPSISL